MDSTFVIDYRIARISRELSNSRRMFPCACSGEFATRSDRSKPLGFILPFQAGRPSPCCEPCFLGASLTRGGALEIREAPGVPVVFAPGQRELQGNVACAQFQLGGNFGCWESTQNVRS